MCASVRAYMCVFACLCMYIDHSTCMETRKQLYGVSSLLFSFPGFQVINFS